ncbi:MAG: response regulator [Calditrichaeota bacterium]|nr:MAG: response regulator [Calditrichota bacterium]
MLSILIIDDSEIIRNLLNEYLTELGHKVEFAVNGQEGIDKALAGDYHIIFCDIHMPRKNGYIVFKEVTKSNPDQIFIMTDSLPDSLAEKAHEEGAWCILTKPFDLNELNEVLQGIINRVSV